MAEADEILVERGSAERQRRMDVRRTHNRVVPAGEKSGHLGAVAEPLAPVVRESVDAGAILLQLIQPAGQQRMDAGRTDIAKIAAQAVAAIRADQFHLDLVGGIQAGRPGLFHAAASCGKRRRRRAHHARHFRIGGGETVVGVERDPQLAHVAPRAGSRAAYPPRCDRGHRDRPAAASR